MLEVIVLIAGAPGRSRGVPGVEAAKGMDAMQVADGGGDR